MIVKELIKELDCELKAIAFKLARQYRNFDSDDFLQEMYLYLWENFKEHSGEGITKSYILQGCWFHLKNFIRTSKNKFSHASLDYSEGCLGDIIPEEYESYTSLDFKVAVSEVMNNGLSKREKKVFTLSLEGYTLREIGEQLKVSHVMVYKIKNSIKKKVNRQAVFLLV